MSDVKIRWVIKDPNGNVAAAPHPSKSTACLIFKSEDDAEGWVRHMNRPGCTIQKIEIREVDTFPHKDSLAFGSDK